MPRRLEATGHILRAGLALAAVVLAACTSPQAIRATSTGETSTPSAAVAPSASASAASTAVTSSSGGGRCATAQLGFSLGPSTGAAGNEIQTVTLTNASSTSCFLGDYPGVELLDANGHPLQDAQWSTDSFFGPYPSPHRVDIAAGGTTTFDLTYGGIDPCGRFGPAQRPASLKITPPGDFDSTTIAANMASTNGQTMIVCPNSLTVHPVGSRPQRG